MKTTKIILRVFKTFLKLCVDIFKFTNYFDTNFETARKQETAASYRSLDYDNILSGVIKDFNLKWTLLPATITITAVRV